MQNPRVNYEMTEEDLNTLLDACKPTPCMMIGSYVSPSPQENANRAWASLGRKMGFDAMTVRPGRGDRFFTAVPSETEGQKQERLEHEAETKRLAEITELRTKIIAEFARLKELDGCQGFELGDGNFSGCSGTGGDCPACGE